ncbi:pilus assembly protein [Marinobacter sp. UBA3607]|jgi:type IV pilus assembly protein PilY1|uniref:pilus assembly protein n=1 Tax=Marinobacter sp. UBA3607 TaxID=1946820 RepID=UPI002580C482|nr:PilC/PilY family type IV pilus protein [Marinobacter sp. UBA3607]
MKIYTGRLAAFIFGFSMALSSTVTVADDTEIFFNTESTSIRPNLLFILDNSGSMDAMVTIKVPSDPVYNPSKTYSGSYNSDRIYYGSPSNYDSFSESQLKCEDMKARIPEVGVLKSYRMAYKRKTFGGWVDFDRLFILDQDVGCEADNNIKINWERDITLRDFYYGNYLNWQNSGDRTVEMTRLEVMQGVARDLADTITGVNIGLMAFDTVGPKGGWPNNQYRGEGGVILEAVRPVSESHADFKAAVDALGTDTNTPLSETLFGAKRYFEGGSPFLSQTSSQASNAMDGNSYKSPIELECQSNNIVLLTDGDPTKDRNHETSIESVIGNCEGNCLDEIAGYMRNNDMSGAHKGVQNVTTYTVGFSEDAPGSLLGMTAKAGGGKYYKATDAQQLAGAFDDIVRSVLETSSTFVAPGIAVNSFNRLNHFNALYYSVFEPDTRPLWEGNLKRYKISDSGKIVDANGNEAIDPVTGFFKDGAQSWWASVPDGKSVTAGGVRTKLPDATDSRNVYTWISGKDLTASGNLISTSNTDSLTKSLLGDSSMTDPEQQALIRWIRGEDVKDEDGDNQTNDARKFVSDPLHSEPKLIVYGGTEASPDTAVFFGDNQGYVHAINGKTGESHFAFMPAELLKNQRTLMDNSATVADRIYGMDGSIVSWVKNPRGAIDASDGDHVYLYTGMRRGGRSYYALDVTDRAKPKAMWHISGGTGDFSELGQSWSTPVKSRINLDGTVKDVLFFAGGYDAGQDNARTRSEDAMGRALYIVDAETGKRLWWAGPKEEGSTANLKLEKMKYSIPASPKVLDIDGDGLADQVYVGDMGGQVWRFDLNNGNSVDSFATGGPIADFAGDDLANARRFYHTPDLSISSYWGKRYLTLVIGSGYHAHPLNKVIEDRAYMLRIPSLYGAPADSTGTVSYTTHTESDLFDITDNKIGEGNDSEKHAAEQSLASASGWMLKFENSGEKMLSSSIVVDGVATFTTYEPAAALSACAPSTGRSRLYSVLLRDGRPVRNYDGLDGVDDLKKSDRSKDVTAPGIPPSPKLLRTEESAFICVGTNCEQVENSNTFTQTFWREVE